MIRWPYKRWAQYCINPINLEVYCRFSISYLESVGGVWGHDLMVLLFNWLSQNRFTLHKGIMSWLCINEIALYCNTCMILHLCRMHSLSDTITTAVLYVGLYQKNNVYQLFRRTSHSYELEFRSFALNQVQQPPCLMFWHCGHLAAPVFLHQLMIRWSVLVFFSNRLGLFCLSNMSNALYVSPAQRHFKTSGKEYSNTQ